MSVCSQTKSVLLLWLLMTQVAAAGEWGYEGDSGPDHWASLDEANALCANGFAQSPIDLVATAESTSDELEREFGPSSLSLKSRAHVMDLVDNGHTIQITSDASVTLRLDDRDYHLVQFHFHAPSEHMLGGRHLPLESHFVMATDEGDLAVLGVLYDEGQHDPAFDPVLSALPDGPGDERHLENLDLELSGLKPLPQRYFQYTGSLTTPPCTEGVRWIVVAEPQFLSSAQVAALSSHLHDNYRPIQPRHKREVLLIEAVNAGSP